jgi:hypothetical protein
MAVVIKATWDEAFAEGIGDAGVEGSRASRPLAMLKIGAQQLFSAADADVVVDGLFARRFDKMKTRLQ